MRQPFFLLDSQVIRIFRLKNRLIILSHPNLSTQKSFDHLKDCYLHDSWENMFSSYKGSIGKLLTDHLLRDDNRLEEDVIGQ